MVKRRRNDYHLWFSAVRLSDAQVSRSQRNEQSRIPRTTRTGGCVGTNRNGGGCPGQSANGGRHSTCSCSGDIAGTTTSRTDTGQNLTGATRVNSGEQRCDEVQGRTSKQSTRSEKYPSSMAWVDKAGNRAHNGREPGRDSPGRICLGNPGAKGRLRFERVAREQEYSICWNPRNNGYCRTAISPTVFRASVVCCGMYRVDILRLGILPRYAQRRS